MNVLIVHAHPEPQSFNSALSRLGAEYLRQAGHQVQVSDLYAMGWNPVASAADFGSRQDGEYLVYAKEQRHGYEEATIARDIQCELSKLQWCDTLILNFPVFWFSAPAILKGWIDRVLISGLCYGGRRIYDRGGMRGKRAMISITLGGRRHMFGPQAIHGEIATMLSPIQRGTLAYVGFEVLEPFVGYHIPYITNEERAQVLEEFLQHLSKIETLKPMAFPSMLDFDELLHPIHPGPGGKDF